jgi:dienelactone hydrolase
MPAVRIHVEGHWIHGQLVHPSAADGRVPGVLFVHGWGSSQEDDLGSARQLARRAGVVCLTVNLRGHGHTRDMRDRVSRLENLADVAAAYDFLAAEAWVDRARIGVVGSSYGGYLAVLLTGMRPVRWLALQAPALYKDDGFERPKAQLDRAELDLYRRLHLPSHTNLGLRAGAGFRGEVLVVESEHDTIIPHEVIANYLRAFSAAGCTHHLMAGASHGLGSPDERRAYTEALLEWFKPRLAPPPP